MRQQSCCLQRRRNGDIENAVRPSMHVDRGLQNLKRPGMDLDRPQPGLPVEPADVAIDIVNAHQGVHARNRCERRIDGGSHFGVGCARDFDLDEGAEQRSRAANSIGGDCHRLPIPASHLR